ncbi:glycoside hydrolase superfamily [Cryomyces antarcticus]
MSVAKSNNKRKWWKEAVVYQIYPASFLDSGAGTRPGWGDVRGITSKIDYLQDLGVDIVWLSPIYKSPQADMGYDISDYKDIDPMYGTLEDVDRLIHELKKRNMKLMMDLVVNHTSDQHAWFLESRSSLDNPKRDWYIWKKPRMNADGTRVPPNNWSQILGEANSAWTYDAQTGEYFLALFTPEQPDLNWENPAVRAAVHDVLAFWLDRGVAGFRMDVINMISKDQSFPDGEVVAPDHKYQPGFKYFANGPRLHEFLREINTKVLSKYDTITVGEMPFVRDEEEILKVVGAEAGELNMIFIFELVDIDNVPGSYRLTLREWDANEIKTMMNRWQRLMIDRDGWNTIFCENHDNPRSVSRYCDDSDEHRERGAKMLCLMQTTLAGTLYVYQGEELGMRNVPASWPAEEYKDIEAVNYWKKMNAMHPHSPTHLAHARHVLQRKARDHSRTPVQWSAAPHAGFCAPDVTPWMRVNDDYSSVNAEMQMRDGDAKGLSVRQFWQRALAHRKKHRDVFVYGDFQLVDADNPKVFAFKRTSAQIPRATSASNTANTASPAKDLATDASTTSTTGPAATAANKDEPQAFLTVLNFSGGDIDWAIPEDVEMAQWVTGNYTAGRPALATSGVVALRAWEGLLGEVAV